MSLLVIDNYDSFTYNLVQAFGKLGEAPVVFRNDAITVEAVLDIRPERIVVSPGPGTPASAGVSVSLVRRLGREVPILGVCLGMQCINEAYGGRTVHAPIPVHGKTSLIEHDGRGLFRGIPNRFRSARYHSLVVDELSEEFEVTARTPEGVVMALRHRSHPVAAVQFHPESFMTDHGETLLGNFLAGSL